MVSHASWEPHGMARVGSRMLCGWVATRMPKGRGRAADLCRNCVRVLKAAGLVAVDGPNGPQFIQDKEAV